MDTQATPEIPFVYVSDPLGWMAQMVVVYRMMSDQERADLHAWEREHLGQGGVGTSDWPGWERHIGPYPGNPKPAPPRKEQLPPAVREAVYARDGRVCAHCGATEGLSIDHIVATAKGGGDDLANLQVLCRSCNSRKGTRSGK